jgi:hypothetical protein
MHDDGQAAIFHTRAQKKDQNTFSIPLDAKCKYFPIAHLVQGDGCVLNAFSIMLWIV